MTAQTFAQIKDLAFALPMFRVPMDQHDLNNTIQCMVIDAEESAMTLGGDALAILESNLCFCEDHAVCKWFSDNDVAF